MSLHISNLIPMNFLAFASITSLLLFIINSKLDYLIHHLHISPAWRVETIIHQRAFMIAIRLLASTATVIILLRVLLLMIKLMVTRIHQTRERSKPIAFIYTRVDFYKHMPRPEQISNANCSICLCEGSSDAVLECGHVFHWNCVRPWLDSRNACPLCKRRQTRRGMDVTGSFVDDE